MSASTSKPESSHNIKIKKNIDERCQTDTDCYSGECRIPTNCNLVFKDTSLCHSAKTCQTSISITQPSNFSNKNINIYSK